MTRFWIACSFLGMSFLLWEFSAEACSVCFRNNTSVNVANAVKLAVLVLLGFLLVVLIPLTRFFINVRKRSLQNSEKEGSGDGS